MPLNDCIDNGVPPLQDYEKMSLFYSLRYRVELLLTQKSDFKELVEKAKLPFLDGGAVSTDKMKNPPSFFKRSPLDIVEEMRGILHGHFAICEKLSIINAPKFPMKRTEEQFNSLQPELIEYANDQLDLLLAAHKPRNRLS